MQRKTPPPLDDRPGGFFGSAGGPGGTLFMCEGCRQVFATLGEVNSHDCREVDTGAADTSNLEDQANDEVTAPTQSVHWTKAQTLNLIDMYEQIIPQVQAGKKRKKIMWDEIAKTLPFTSEQCNGRFRTITNAYKNAKDRQNKTGTGRKNKYEYQDRLDELYGQSPNIRPVATASSTDDRMLQFNDTADEDEELNSQSGDDDIEETPKRKKKSQEEGPPTTKRRTSQLSKVLEQIERMEERAAERDRLDRESRQAMHNQKMELFKEYISRMK